MKSSLGPMLEHAEVGAYLDDGTLQVRPAPVEVDHAPRAKHRQQRAEDDLREWYKSFGVGVTMPSDLGRASHSNPDLYNSGQCDFTAKSKFAQSRRAHAQWLALPRTTRATLAAWYLGMNPTEPDEVRAAYQTAFEDYAAVAYWASVTIPLGDKTTEGERVQLRIDLENRVRAAHREWYNVGQRLDAAKATA